MSDDNRDDQTAAANWMSAALGETENTAITNFAGIIGMFYMRLTEAGVPEEDATRLTEVFMTTSLMGMGMKTGR